ncbi:MAG: polyamine transporter ATP-binding protein [Pseudonocardiales bacterium]|nr:polyamine transporter ATP-binding protein [Pseudonocardiales bacterium]
MTTVRDEIQKETSTVEAMPANETETSLKTAGAWVQLNDIVKLYGSTPAVDGVSLDIPPGQFVTLLGASGSGKTTLLRIIAGFLDATSGQIVIDRKEISRVPVHKRHIGMVFQNYALFPHMTVEKNVAFPLARQKVPRRARKEMIAEALAAVHLTGYENRLPRELSGGQQQRVALARAIVARPRLLLMDEPLGALDRRLRESLQIEIRRLSRDLGLTVINVTHDQEEALTMSDRIALLADGKLVQYGTPEELYSNPSNEVAARFIGESNIFTGTVHGSPRGATLSTSAGQIILPDTASAELNGNEARIVVRPSAVTVVKASAAIDQSVCSMPGTLIANIFAGDSRKVVVDGDHGSELIVRMDASEPFGFEVGEPVVLTWKPSASLAMVA